MRYSILVKLNFSAFPRKTAAPSYLKTIQVLENLYGRGGGGEVQIDLLWNVGISLLLWVLFLKCHYHLIFLLNLLKSFRTSVWFIKNGVGERLKPFSSPLIFVCDKTFFAQIKDIV